MCDDLALGHGQVGVGVGRRLGVGVSAAPRRHSITVGQADSLVHAASASASAPHARRQSIHESIHSITKSLTTSVQRALHVSLRGSSPSLHSHPCGHAHGHAHRHADEARAKLSKAFFTQLLGEHLKNQDIKVTRVSLRPKTPVCPREAVFEAEVHFKDSRGRKKLDVVAKVATLSDCDCDDDDDADDASSEANREIRTYAEVVQNMWSYLRNEKSIAEPELYLCLPTRYHSTKSCSDEAGGSVSSDEVLVLQDLAAAGFKAAPLDGSDDTGLDFTHSIMAISRLARFHAVSYCMRKERRLRLREAYPVLTSDPVYRPDTASAFSRAQSSLATRVATVLGQAPRHLRAHSAFFVDAVGQMHATQTALVSAGSVENDFEVLCHGDLRRHHVLFFYGRGLECRSDCVDVRFDDLHHARAASCVTDLLLLLFASVDAHVRREHMMDLLAVYHDHFSKTVSKLAPEVSAFGRQELFDEFRRCILFGFLEGVTLLSSAYEAQLLRLEAEAEPDGIETEADSIPKYSDYRDRVMAMVADVVRIKFQESQETAA